MSWQTLVALTAKMQENFKQMNGQRRTPNIEW